jgi:hypothetical protein
LSIDLRGLHLRYLIGADNPGPGVNGYLTVVGYDIKAPVKHGVSGKYINLYDEKNTHQFAPYLPPTDTSQSYDEPVPDPRGNGFWKNLQQQVARAKEAGFTLIGDVDNRDAYHNSVIVKVYDRLMLDGLDVICKNPGMSDHNEYSVPLLMHPAVVGCIVEHGSIGSDAMHGMRKAAGKPDLQCWFVAFGSGKKWALAVAAEIRKAKYVNMGVTYSPRGEYESSETIV